MMEFYFQLEKWWTIPVHIKPKGNHKKIKIGTVDMNKVKENMSKEKRIFVFNYGIYCGNNIFNLKGTGDKNNQFERERERQMRGWVETSLGR